MAARTGAAARSSPEFPDRELVLTRVFDAPRALVFKAWIQPERLVRWWGPKGFTTPSCKMDPRPGGNYRFHMRSPQGTDHHLQGAYREIVEPERLVFTWAWLDERGKPRHETVLTVTFTEYGKKTKLALHQAIFESVTARDAHQGGWISGLDCL
ncbi:MAG: SRPBCC domain-containing protein, partial [Dongiaceae bacterium]